MPEAAFADVDAGRILLRAPFSNLLLCKRVPGGSWDTARRVWTYPATPQHARLIRASIPRLQASDKFSALLTPKPAAEVQVQPAPAPPAQPEATVELPAGLKTTPWRHQIDAFRFAMERLLRGGGAARLRDQSRWRLPTEMFDPGDFVAQSDPPRRPATEEETTHARD